MKSERGNRYIPGNATNLCPGSLLLKERGKRLLVSQANGGIGPGWAISLVFSCLYSL